VREATRELIVQENEKDLHAGKRRGTKFRARASHFQLELGLRLHGGPHAPGIFVMAAVLLLVANSAFGNEKKKPAASAYRVERAHGCRTHYPDAGISPSAPLANKTAQEDVEKALEMGRLNPVVST